MWYPAPPAPPVQTLAEKGHSWLTLIMMAIVVGMMIFSLPLLTSIVSLMQSFANVAKDLGDDFSKFIDLLKALIQDVADCFQQQKWECISLEILGGLCFSVKAAGRLIYGTIWFVDGVRGLRERRFPPKDSIIVRYTELMKLTSGGWDKDFMFSKYLRDKVEAQLEKIKGQTTPGDFEKLRLSMRMAIGSALIQRECDRLEQQAAGTEHQEAAKQLGRDAKIAADDAEAKANDAAEGTGCKKEQIDGWIHDVPE
jgi:hypothetical protein